MNRRQKIQLAKHGLDRPIFYDDGNSTTVCLLTKNGIPVARGISICSFLDVFSELEGRNKAFGRAIQAFVNKKDLDMSNSLSYLINHYSLTYSVRLHNAFLLYKNFATYRPDLLPLEVSLVENRRRKLTR